MSVSAVILTLNEAANLPRCIESLHWCDDVVVLDSGSSDDTQKVAEELGARVFTHQQPPPFKIDQQRNWALDHCDLKHPWVFFLDADEVVSTKLQEQLIRTCNDSAGKHNAYELTPRYLFLGKWMKRTQGYPNWHARLLKKDEVRFEGGVWEQFDSQANIGRIEEPYDHFANSKGLSDWLARHDRYSSWDAEKVFNFLKDKNTESLETTRKLKLRILAARLWPLRPYARFVQMYFFRLGFLEGWQSFVFCHLYFFYELMTVVKIIELKRKKKNLSI